MIAWRPLDAVQVGGINTPGQTLLVLLPLVFAFSVVVEPKSKAAQGARLESLPKACRLVQPAVESGDELKRSSRCEHGWISGQEPRAVDGDPTTADVGTAS